MSKRTIHVGHSPDSDDAFMFFALAKGLVETGDFTYEHILEDIETLNRRALKGELRLAPLAFTLSRISPRAMRCFPVVPAWATDMARWLWHGSRIHWTNCIRRLSLCQER